MIRFNKGDRAMVGNHGAEGIVERVREVRGGVEYEVRVGSGLVITDGYGLRAP